MRRLNNDNRWRRRWLSGDSSQLFRHQSCLNFQGDFGGIHLRSRRGCLSRRRFDKRTWQPTRQHKRHQSNQEENRLAQHMTSHKVQMCKQDFKHSYCATFDANFQ